MKNIFIGLLAFACSVYGSQSHETLRKDLRAELENYCLSTLPHFHHNQAPTQPLIKTFVQEDVTAAVQCEEKSAEIRPEQDFTPSYALAEKTPHFYNMIHETIVTTKKDHLTDAEYISAYGFSNSPGSTSTFIALAPHDERFSRSILNKRIQFKTVFSNEAKKHIAIIKIEGNPNNLHEHLQSFDQQFNMIVPLLAHAPTFKKQKTN